MKKGGKEDEFNKWYEDEIDKEIEKSGMEGGDFLRDVGLRDFVMLRVKKKFDRLERMGIKLSLETKRNVFRTGYKFALEEYNSERRLNKK